MNKELIIILMVIRIEAVKMGLCHKLQMKCPVRVSMGTPYACYHCPLLTISHKEKYVNQVLYDTPSALEGETDE